MKVTVAIDSFKGSLSTFEAGEAVAEGIRRVVPDAQVWISPLADGGEGTVSAIVAGTKGSMRRLTVTGPLGTPISCEYGVTGDQKTAILEMSAAAGITLVSPEERNPLVTTTYGVGQMIAHAMESGCRSFLVGIGGSATNDGGIGMLQALGFSFLNQKGEPVSFGARGLEELAEIRTDGAHPLLSECTFRVACDVKNPLCGENGCSAIYGPQKGATPEMVAQMDEWMRSYAKLAKAVCPDADDTAPGAGAAGGMGFALRSFLSAKLESGIGLVMEATGLENLVRDSDVVVTGEGRLDGQSCMGKAPVGVAGLAKQYGKTVVAFSGCVTPDAGACNENGIDAFFPILRTPCSLREAMDVRNASANLADTAEQVFRLLALSK